MIAIVNVDTNPRESGLHKYSIRINRLEVGTCYHYREEPLSLLLHRASVQMAMQERSGGPK